MYESISYQELKSLPKQQKSDAWKELKAMYSTQKELAEKLGVSPSIVYSMISRYAKEDTVRGRRAKKLEVVEKPRRTRKRLKNQESQPEQVLGASVQEVKPVLEAPIILGNSAVENDTFSISIKKTISGEDAQFFLSGIGNTLLKGQKYTVEVKITEK